MIEITHSPLEPQEIARRLNLRVHGALVTFAGTSRLYSEGKTVNYLEYEAFQEMAEKKLREVEEGVRSRWPVEDMAIVHRLGRLQIGEPSLVVVVATQHRREAFEACQFAVDTLKETVPIWKKEVWAEGAAWVGGHEG